MSPTLVLFHFSTITSSLLQIPWFFFKAHNIWCPLQPSLSILGNIWGQIGRAPEQPGLAEGIPGHYRIWMAFNDPFQPKPFYLWFSPHSCAPSSSQNWISFLKQKSTTSSALIQTCLHPPFQRLGDMLVPQSLPSLLIPPLHVAFVPHTDVAWQGIIHILWINLEMNRLKYFIFSY